MNEYECTERKYIHDYMFSLFNQYMQTSSKSLSTSISTYGDMKDGTSHEASESFAKADAFKIALN